MFPKTNKAHTTEKPNKGFEVKEFHGRKHASCGSARHLGAPSFHWTRDSLGKIKHRSVRFRGRRRQAEREFARLVNDQ
jgi:hypothetical protein